MEETHLKQRFVACVKVEQWDNGGQSVDSPVKNELSIDAYGKVRLHHWICASIEFTHTRSVADTLTEGKRQLCRFHVKTSLFV
jgi:hypothetical protein